MKKKPTRATIGVDRLESRALLTASSTQIQADLANIKADRQAIQAEQTTLAPTLRADNQAITAAIKAAQSTSPVQTAQATLKTDNQASATLLRADLKAIFQATSATRSAALTQFKTDATRAASTFQADTKAVQTAINADPGVTAARAKLTTDSAALTPLQDKLQADLAQLRTDLG